jgi:hypothetical protein
MSVCSFLVITRRHTEIAVAGLLGVVVTQGLGYGLIFDLNFFLRNLSVVGGLLMVLSDSWVRKKFVPAGLPQLDEKDRKMYVQFAGRVLLIFLFVGFVFSGQWSLWRVSWSSSVSRPSGAPSFSWFCSVSSTYSSITSGPYVHFPLRRIKPVTDSYSQLHPHHPHKDFAKYDFFQILSIV